MLTAKYLNSTNPYALQEELDWITQHTKTLKEGAQVIMLGAGPGVLALAAVEGNPHIELAVIDHDTTHWSSTHLKAAEYYRGSYIQDDSAYVGSMWYDPVDFLIVDADHSYEGVKKDIMAWWGTVEIGSCVFFHDYLERENGFNGQGAWTVGGVAKAIEKLRNPSWKFVAQVGISIVYQKVAA